MITTMQSVNFKCFAETSLEIRRLTLLTGFNAGGKSSSYQGALMLSGALRAGGRSIHVPLNTSRIRLGTAGDVLHQTGEYGDVAAPKIVSFSFNDAAGFSIGWQLAPSKTGVPFVFDLIGVKVKRPHEDTQEVITDLAGIDGLLPLSLRHGPIQEIASSLAKMMYVSTDRHRGGDLFPMPASGVPIAKDVGASGEYAAWYLSTSIEDVEAGRLHPDEPAQTLGRQLNAWGQELFSGFSASSSAVERTGFLRLVFKTSVTEEWRSPSNVGYGLGYAFPILIAGLVADDDQLLVIDSPEAHLHPRAQSRMGGFLSRVANRGPQIIAETHSDHVLNGVRLAVKEKTIAEEDVIIHFFQENPIDNQRVISATLDHRGRLSHWPAGFFDQIELDLAKL